MKREMIDGYRSDSFGEYGSETALQEAEQAEWEMQSDRQEDGWREMLHHSKRSISQETGDDQESPGDAQAPAIELVPVDDIIDLYLKEMASVPLLSSEEETQLAKRLDEGREAEQALQSNGHTPDQVARLEEIVRQGRAAREHLIAANTRLVVSIAKKYRERGVPFLDLIQEGNIGLMKAVDRFDHTRGYRLSTYATWWIRQTVTRAIADQGRTIRMPVHMGDQIRRLYQVAQRLESKINRRPTPEEIADEMDIDAQRVRWMLDISRYSTSLQRLVGEDKDTELGALIEDTHTPSPTESTNETVMREQIDRALGTIPAREARILRLRFGLHDGHTYTLEEIGEKFGLTRERIRQLEGKALRRLRHPRRSRRLRDYHN
jgi:RNA polymerase primary sigma factor